MNNLNSCLIEGNLVRDPALKLTSSGTNLCTFTIASNRYHKVNEEFEKEVSFFDVEVFGKQAEFINKNGRKGRGVRVVGRLKQYRWECKDGKIHSRIAVIAEHVEFRPVFKKNETHEESYEDFETVDNKLSLYEETKDE